MKVLICGGDKTPSIVSNMSGRFKQAGLDFVGSNNINSIIDIINRGDYYDRAVFFERGLTDDGEYSSEYELRERLANFVDSVIPKTEQGASYVFVLDNEGNAKVITEELMGIPNKRIFIKNTSRLSAKFLAMLVAKPLDDMDTSDLFDLDAYNDRLRVDEELLYSSNNMDIGGEQLSGVKEYDIDTEIEYEDGESNTKEFSGLAFIDNFDSDDIEGRELLDIGNLTGGGYDREHMGNGESTDKGRVDGGRDRGYTGKNGEGDTRGDKERDTRGDVGRDIHVRDRANDGGNTVGVKRFKEEVGVLESDIGKGSDTDSDIGSIVDRETDRKVNYGSEALNMEIPADDRGSTVNEIMGKENKDSLIDGSIYNNTDDGLDIIDGNTEVVSYSESSISDDKDMVDDSIDIDVDTNEIGLDGDTDTLDTDGIDIVDSSEGILDTDWVDIVDGDTDEIGVDEDVDGIGVDESTDTLDTDWVDIVDGDTDEIGVDEGTDEIGVVDKDIDNNTMDILDGDEVGIDIVSDAENSIGIEGDEDGVDSTDNLWDNDNSNYPDDTVGMSNENIDSLWGDTDIKSSDSTNTDTDEDDLWSESSYDNGSNSIALDNAIRNSNNDNVEIIGKERDKVREKRDKVGLFGLGKGKKGKEKEKERESKFFKAKQRKEDSGIKKGRESSKSDTIRLESILDTYRNRGCSIVVTGTSCSGKSVIAYNLANLIRDLGYTVLIVDLDTVGRSQSYISKQSYESTHSLDAENSSLKQALNAINHGASEYVNIVKPNLHLLSLGLAGDTIVSDKLAPKNRVARFCSNIRNNYNFIIYDIPFKTAVDYASDVTFTADNIIMTCDCNTHGFMNLMLDMSNIDNEDMQETMFCRSQLCVTKYIDFSNILGGSVKGVKDALTKVDIEVQGLLGIEPEYFFSNMSVCGIIPYNEDYNTYWLKDNQITDTPNGRSDYLKLLSNILIRK